MPETAFRDRYAELKLIGTDTNWRLLDVYGEAGIGKTRLLREAQACLGRQKVPPLIVNIDLAGQAALPACEACRGVITTTWQALPDGLPLHAGSAEYQAGQLLARIEELTLAATPVYLIFDTTEAYQENMAFWGWLESNLVVPLLTMNDLVKQVFAGRLPVPWREPRCRMTCVLRKLGPLDQASDARALVHDVIAAQLGDAGDGWPVDEATALVLGQSFGHPKLSKLLAEQVTRYQPPLDWERIEAECAAKVRVFIDQVLFVFDAEHEDWREILWKASVLEKFDAFSLPLYLKKVAPALADQPQDYYIKGIQRLRLHHRVVFSADKGGDQLFGVLKDIVRHCFAITDPAGYELACKAARDVEAELQIAYAEP